MFSCNALVASKLLLRASSSTTASSRLPLSRWMSSGKVWNVYLSGELYNHENYHEKEQTSTTSSTSAEDKQHFEENMKKITEWFNNSLPKSGNITKFPKDFFTEMRDKFPDLQPWLMT